MPQTAQSEDSCKKQCGAGDIKKIDKATNTTNVLSIVDKVLASLIATRYAKSNKTIHRSRRTAEGPPHATKKLVAEATMPW